MRDLFLLIVVIFLMSLFGCASNEQSGGGMYAAAKNLKSLESPDKIGNYVMLNAEFRGKMKNMIGGKVIEAASFTDSSMVDGTGIMLNFWVLYPKYLARKISEIKTNKKYTIYGVVKKTGVTYYLDLKRIH